MPPPSKEQLLTRLAEINEGLVDEGAKPDMPVERARGYEARYLRLIVEESSHRLALLISMRSRG